MSLIAETAVSGTAYSFDMLFSYTVPEHMKLKRGCRVLVPFGRGNTRRIGVVMRLSEGSSVRLKPVAAQIDEEPVVSEELLRLAEYLREQTFCTYFDAVKIMLPPGMGVKAKENFRLVRGFENVEQLTPEADELLETLRHAENDREVTELLESYIAENGRRLPDELLDAGALDSNNVFRQNVGDASVRMVRLSDEYLADPSKFDLTPKQKTAAEFLQEYGSAAVREAAYMCGFTEAVIKRLAASGAAVEYDMEVLRGVEDGSEERIDPDSVVLSDEQQAVRDSVYAQITENKPAVFLLHGVTGSGKTSVLTKNRP